LNYYPVKIKYLNNPEYFWAITYEETKTYSYDRIWHNKNAYPMSPVILNGKVYNAENKSYFFTTYLENFYNN
jgi:hypothetical protein